MIPLDPNVLQRRASDPESSVWVAASAGSGKTKVLTDRVLRLMLDGTPPARILCLTFTKAAAAEMAIRIHRTLGHWATMETDALVDALAALTNVRPAPETVTAARRLFARVVDCPGGMKIQTIHAFCQSLLRRFPVEARLAPHFEVMDDRAAAALLGQARDQVLRDARAEPQRPLGRAFQRLSADLSAPEFGELMSELAGERGRLARILDAHGGIEPTIAAVHRALDLPADIDETRVLAEASVDAALDVEALRAACRALAGGSATDQARGMAIQRWLDDPPARPAGFEAYRDQFLTVAGTPRKTLATKAAQRLSPEAAPALEAEAQRLVAVSRRLRSAAVAASTAALLRLAQALLAVYAEAKGGRALMDYDDLILAAHALLAGPDRVPWVLYKLDGGLDHILIDEAQDTNPEQWQVVNALAEEFFAGLDARREGGVSRTVFAVGDEKQSIFSFQRADPAEFARMRRHFRDMAKAAERRFDAVELDVSFRSTAAVLETVDAVFADPATREGLAFDADHEIHHRAFRRGMGGSVELWPPVSPPEAVDPEPWAPPLAREGADRPAHRLARIIAATIHGWIRDGERLEARGRPIQPGDILVLVRRRTDFVAELVRALKERAVPVAGVDRMRLTGQLAVQDLMVLAEFLLLPEDDLALATVLKGPLIGLSEEELFQLAWGRKGGLWPALLARAHEDAGFAPARGYLADLLARTDFVRPYELFAGVLSAPCPTSRRGGRAAILGRLGVDALDPLDEFLATCLAFERTQPPSLQGFLAWLQAADAEIKRELEQGSGRVRIMTVHGSKGLQAPIVFLPDTMAMPTRSPTILWPRDGETIPLFAPRRAREDEACAARRAEADRRRDQEYRRLLYVALTRAEDRLIVAGWRGKRDAPDGCWYRLVETAMRAQAQPVAFDFTGAMSAMGWVGEGWRLRGAQDRPPIADHAQADAARPPAPAPDWWSRPAPAEPEPFRPLAPSRPDEAEPAVRSPLGADDGRRFKRGVLIHRLLQTVPALAPEAREPACRRYLARPVHGLDPAQQNEIARETMAVLEHPDFAPLFQPGSLAEVPVVGVLGSRALSGRIDRLAVVGDTVWIVDYKTNRPPPSDPLEVPEVYVAQMRAYRAAVAAIHPGREVRCVLLWTDGPFLMELAAGRLEPPPAPSQPSRAS